MVIFDWEFRPLEKGRKSPVMSLLIYSQKPQTSLQKQLYFSLSEQSSLAPLFTGKNLYFLTICMLGNFSCFCCHLLTFFFNSRNSFRNTIRVLNGLDKDQNRCSQLLSSNLGPNCLKRLSPDDKVAATKERDKKNLAFKVVALSVHTLTGYSIITPFDTFAIHVL